MKYFVILIFINCNLFSPSLLEKKIYNVETRQCHECFEYENGYCDGELIIGNFEKCDPVFPCKINICDSTINKIKNIHAGNCRMDSRILNTAKEVLLFTIICNERE